MYQQVLNAIKAENKSKVPGEAELAANILKFFGGNLDHATAQGKFVYHKGGGKRCVSSAKEIVKRWDLFLLDNPFAEDLEAEERWNEIIQNGDE